jgi:folate-binding protein YgfZ
VSAAVPDAETVVVDGPDAHSYLDSQCTQDLSSLAVGDTAPTLVLQPSGVLVTVASVTRTDAASLSVEVPWGAGGPTAARLRRFAIRAELTVHEPVPVGHSETFGGVARLRAGIPGPAELARELVPHALAAALRERCVSFTKGCYPGQELVARMQARGATPPYVLRGLSADAPIAAGDPVGDAGFDGAVTSVLPDPDGGGWLALCVLHRRDAQGATVEVRSGVDVVVARMR